jgi:predicted nuclease of predicted toxin-antitoxin system
MFTYLIDENMPFLSIWNKEDFVHVTDLPFIHFDTDIWSYAFENQLTIITKDSDFYYRYLSSRSYPKVIWIKTGNIKKDVLIGLIEVIWKDIEEMLLKSSFIIITEDKIERF